MFVTSRKGNIVKTWELMLQVGEAGNWFKNMSAKDPKVVDALIQAMKNQLDPVIHSNEPDCGDGCR